MRKKRSILTISLQLLVVLAFILGIYLFMKGDKVGDNQTKKAPLSSSQTNKSSSQGTASSAASAKLPKVSADDWELVLVNRQNITEEMNPDVTAVNGIYIDSRIADNVEKFLAAAQAIDPSEHLISGYRSVAYQTELYQGYVAQEMANDASLTQSAAEEVVQTYSQPAGASEHQTGLAIDMSTVDSLNASDADVVAQVQQLAPKYGFVLRFPEGKKDVTGVDYEDWHFRYVGVKSAKYMTEHGLTLEEYVVELKESEQ